MGKYIRNQQVGILKSRLIGALGSAGAVGVLALFLSACGNTEAQDSRQAVGKPSVDQPIEIGTVRWGRDLDEALALSKKSQKPVFVLFQEVPG